MKCRACGVEHDSWIRCEVAKARLGGGADSKPSVAVPVSALSNRVAGGPAPKPCRAKFDRNAYQREYMRKRRAG